MLINSVNIKIKKGGAGIGPTYSLTIFGHGKVIYNGVENVKNMGIIESSITHEKIVDILKIFKDINFFSIDEFQNINLSENKPYTIISITIPKGEKETIKKTIKYVHGDKNVPKELKFLEDKIDEMVNSKKWVGDISDVEGFGQKENVDIQKEEKKLKENGKLKGDKRIKKLIIPISIVIIFILILFLVFYLGLFDFSVQSNDNNQYDENDFLKPDLITSLTASNIQGYSNYSEKNSFKQGDKIYVYQVINNLSKNKDDSFDFVIEYNVVNNDIKYLDRKIPFKSYENFTEFNFNTDEFWPPGNYIIYLLLKDNVSEEQIQYTISFLLTEKYSQLPEIILVDTASIVNAYQDYEKKSVFNVNDRVYIYEEYENITIINSNKCDLYLEIIVTKWQSGETVHNDNTSKNVPGNNAHYWFFDTDSTWESGILYEVNAYVTDNISEKTTSKSTLFSLV